MKQRSIVGFVVCLLTGLAASPGTAGEPSKSVLGQKVAPLKLIDSYGQPRSVTAGEGKLTVVAFLGTECPLARLYAPRLEQLQQRFGGSGVEFVAINSNTQDAMTEIAAFARQLNLTYPLLKDRKHEAADMFAAVRTPEVFLLDAEHIVRYRGRIDDQYVIGIQRGKPQREDLAVAIEELLAGKPISVPETEAVGCYIGRTPQVEPHGDVTYASHIAAILNRRCVECHRPGEIAPFSLASYDDVIGWGETILEVIEENRMPPWNANPEYGHFRNDARLEDDEKALLRQWIDNGQPAGDLNQLPPAPQFAEGWRMGEPDQVFVMRDEPFTVPAEGVVEYQYFEVDPGFTEDKFITAAEARPDNRAVVHHIIVYIKPPGADDFRKHGAVDGYAPGSPPSIHPEGWAMHVPAGSKLVFEMHYTPNGTEQQDCSRVGLKFVPREQVKKLVHGAMAANTKFQIPPGEAAHVVTARHQLGHDVMLLNLTPHMHVRGKAFRYEATYPDGKHEVLLDVPRYDFNWQLTYELAEPKRLPKGTEIKCTAVFDNSADNPANPDPTKPVRWGDQSWEEMMIGFFDVVAADPQ